MKQPSSSTNLKVVASKNSKTIQQVNSKALAVMHKLTSRIKSLTNTVAKQLNTINSQQDTFPKLMGTGTSNKVA